ncbi:hypothetical protein [Streptomyces sp. MH60]|uniref:hypothetical protein n=1 Tax=Streptomyces sp. MH60 TaxID=1940758 RepID=UPI000D4577E8|nr:hypothetical protein [Streptomyces sp. MH60]PPS83695.1 hypothetical protein BZZ08_04566 [Streptomyces sp. MH60]
MTSQLDGKAVESYDTRAELIWIGADAIPAVINGLPSLGGFGQLTAIEPFEEVGDPRCGPAGPRLGSTWSRSPAPGPYRKPQKPRPAATSSLPPTRINRTDLYTER